MCEGQRCYTVVFFEIKDQPGVGPFLFIRVPGHMAVRNQPDNPFMRDQFRYGEVEERISRHLYGELIPLFFGAAGKGHAPPFRYVADLFDRLVGADLRGDAAAKVVLSHFICFF